MKNPNIDKDLEKLAAFFEENREPLLRIAKSFSEKTLGDTDAEDMVQEAWLRLSTTRVLKERQDPKYWMGAFIGTIHRVAIDSYRKRQAEKRGGENIRSRLAVESGALQKDSGPQMFDLIESVLTRLTPRQREVFDMSYYSGLESAKIAKKLKVSVRTIALDRAAILEKLLPHRSLPKTSVPSGGSTSWTTSPRSPT